MTAYRPPASIYSSLSGFRPRASGFPREGFFSAALADLLNRLPLDEHIAFVMDVLLEDGPGRAWQAFMAGSPGARLEWKTEIGVSHNGQRGFVDLLLLVNDREAIVVENKIDAGVQVHFYAEINGGMPAGSDVLLDKEPVVDATQLHTYGNWLAGKCRGSDWPGALVMLTHFSEPPDDYGPHGYGVPYVSLRRWRQVWRWAHGLGARTSEVGSGSPMSRRLAAEFATFLEGMNMSANGITLGDGPALASFFAIQPRLERTLGVVAEHLSETRKELDATGISGVNYTAGMACVWSWFHLNVPRGARWYIGWGIRGYA